MVKKERLSEEKEFYELNITGDVSRERRDMFKQYYEEQATKDKRNAKDTFRNFLIEQGMDSRNTDDMWYEFLLSEGYSGETRTMARQFYIDNS